MFLLGLVYSFFPFFLPPVLIIPKLNDKWKKRYSGLILVNFFILFVLSFYISLRVNLEFLGDIWGPIIWSFVANYYMKSKLFPKPSENKSDSTASDEPIK